jgi:hypothetical protein
MNKKIPTHVLESIQSAMLKIFLLFTLLMFFAFKVFESVMKTKQQAFLIAVVISVISAAGFGMYKVRETFVNHNTMFENLSIMGAVRIRPEDKNRGFIYSNNSNFKNGSELTFYDGYKLNGRTYGSVFD